MAGVVYVLTGEGKGKTSAAVGLAVRASGWNKKVIFIQFCKPVDFLTGESNSLSKLSNISFKRFGSCALWGKGKPSFPENPEARQAVEEAMDYATEHIVEYDLVILDEVLYAIEGGLMPQSSLIDLINKKPPEADLVLTGRGASEEIINKADIVSEIKPVKYEAKHKNIKGIDY